MYISGLTKFWDDSGVWHKFSLVFKELNWDSQQGRDRKASILVLGFWDFKLKVPKYPRECRLHANLILENPESANKYSAYAHMWSMHSNNS